MNPRVLVIAATAAAAVLYYLAFGGTNLLLDCGLFALFLGFAYGIATSDKSQARAESPHQAILREEAEWMQAHLAARKEREP
jgi:hypothetical protein